MAIKIEPEDIPVKPETESPELGRGRRKKIQRVPFLPRMKGQHHKAVGFVQTEEDSGGVAPILRNENLENDTEEFNSLRTGSNEESGTDTEEISQGEPLTQRSGQMGTKSLYLDEIATRRGMNSRGYKDPGVLNPPRNCVKVDPESTMMHDMYSGTGYSTKRGVINIQMNKAAPPP